MISLKNRPLAFVTLLLGPFASVAVINAASGSLPASEVMFIQFFTILAWSPLFFSVPSYVLQEVRDNALPNEKGIIRGIRLLFFLFSRNNKDRPLFIISIVTWAAVLTIFHPSIFYVATLLTL